MIRLLLILVAIASTFALILLFHTWSGLGRFVSGKHATAYQQSSQWSGDGFTNDIATNDPQIWPILRRYWRTRNAPKTPTEALPRLERQTSDFDSPPANGLRITWLGHSTMLIEIEGKRILTDPVFGPTTSPSPHFGPTRFFEAPLSINELPKIDAILISHDHYDHLDEFSIRTLAEKKIPILTPLGVGQHLLYWGVDKSLVHEFDWWQEHKLGDLTLVCTPSRHFSGRMVVDKDKTLWSSWALIGKTRRAYFSGDTGMFAGFKEIGERLGPFDVSMIESGAYDKLWADIHLGPEQALEAHSMVNANIMIPIHWGTFNLANHGWTEPVERLLAGAKERNIEVATPRPGESVELGQVLPKSVWWPSIEWEDAKVHPVRSSHLTF